MVLGKGGDVVELGLVDTIGAGGYHDAVDEGMGEGFLVALTEDGEGCEGVGVGLEVGEVAASFGVALAVEFDAFVDLLGDAFAGLAVAGGEGGVVAEDATARWRGWVAVGGAGGTVGTGESGIDGEFLHAMAEMVFEVGGIRIVAHFAKVRKKVCIFARIFTKEKKRI